MTPSGTCALGSVLLLTALGLAGSAQGVDSYRLEVPRGLDLYLPAPVDNPLSAARIEQGKQLFFDRRLSRDGTVACASCHDPARAFSDGRPVPLGVFARVGRRNAPAIVNRAYGRAFFWDGRARTLEEQVVQPIQDRNEMDLSLAEASMRVGLTPGDLARALASYVRSILSGDSPFDRFVEGDREALSAEAREGLRIFRSRGNCTACHVGPTFSDEQFHNTGVAWSGGVLADAGRFGVSGSASDQGAFKTPTLREVARTGPYMHDGTLATLADVIDYYDRGGNQNPGLDPELRPLGLTAGDKQALASFLRALSGVVRDGSGPSGDHQRE